MIDEKLASQLTKIGLSDKAARIYALLFSCGGAFPSKIAEETKINRSTVYKILIDLSVKGLVTEIIKSKKIYYQIEKPQKLSRYTKDNLNRAEDMLERAKNLIPELEGLYSLIPNKPQVRFFEGVEGVRSIYEDHVSENEKYEMLAFSNTAEVVKFLSPKFLKEYIKRKEKIGITTRGITPDKNIDKKYGQLAYKNINKKIWPVLRHIKQEVFSFKIELTIYGDNKTSLLKLDKNQPVGVIIEDKIFHDTMRMIFELAWKGTTQS